MSKEWIDIAKPRFWSVMVAAAIVMTVVVVQPAAACDIPVYEWALLNWPPDTYELLVFHEGPLDTGIATALEALQTEGLPESQTLNLSSRRIAEGSSMQEADAQVWERENPGESPWMALRYPGMPPDFPSLWVGKATLEEIQRISDSPARHAIAEALARPVSHVWVLLKCGNDQKDSEARERLEAGLARIPDILDPETVAPTASITHAIVDMDRRDPEEAVLVHTLLRSEPDLMAYDEPMVFPVFGRGRALYALVGAGIETQNLGDACAYIAGRCSCLVKDANPGVDLLLGADWPDVVSAAGGQAVAPSAQPSPDLPADALPPSARPGWYILGGLAGAFIAMMGVSVLLLRKTFS